MGWDETKFKESTFKEIFEGIADEMRNLKRQARPFAGLAFVVLKAMGGKYNSPDELMGWFLPQLPKRLGTDAELRERASEMLKKIEAITHGGRRSRSS